MNSYVSEQPIDTTQSSRFLIKRGTLAQYQTYNKLEGELYYLTDKKCLANYKAHYQSRIDGGYFKDDLKISSFDRINGGEF